MSSTGTRPWAVGVVWLLSFVCGQTAAAQECPYGYPVDCGTYCCESGAYCENGGCYASSPDPGGGSCPAGYPVDCGTYCCESGAYCQDGACYASNDPDPGGGSCPAGYPVDCGTFCCESGTSCGSNQTCLASSNTDQYIDASCPDGYPVDCGNDFCCPSGSTCTVDGCLGVGGSPIDGSELICASQLVDTDNGSCNLDFCIANSNGSCESYYIVNGTHIYCGGCAADAACVQSAGEACAGRGVSTDPSAPSPSGECCGADNACGWSNDGACDCNGAFASSWDSADCSGDSDSDADSTPEICTVSNVGAPSGAGGASVALLAFGVARLSRRRARR